MKSLCEAAKNGDLEEIKQLLTSESCNIDYRLETGESALFIAVQNCHKEVVEFLLEKNASLSFPIRRKVQANWEVFTQVFKSSYPNGISKLSEDQIAIAKLLCEQNFKQHRPVLYEALYCSLTVLYNPISIYCVGLYCLVSGSENEVQCFIEETFLSTLCSSYDEETLDDFLNTVHIILSISKTQFKKVTNAIVSSCCWGRITTDLVDRQMKIYHSSESKDAPKFLLPLSKIFTFLMSNINIKNAVVSQIEVIDLEHIKSLGKIIKSSVFVRNDEKNNYSEDQLEKQEAVMKTIWSFLLTLLKHYLKCDKLQHANNLILKYDESKENKEYIEEIISRSLEEDIEVCHLLINTSVSFTGRNFVKAIQLGCVDIVERFKFENSLIFSEDSENFLLKHSNLKKFSSRNVKLCVKLLRRGRKKKSQENLKEEYEAEEEVEKFRRFEDAKQQENNLDLSKATADYAQVEKITEVKVEEKHDKETCSDSEFQVVTKNKRNKKNDQSKQKKKRKSKKKKKRCNSEPSAPLYSLDYASHVTTDDEGSMTSERRRRVSSSSSDCSTDGGFCKQVSFSHPISIHKCIDEIQKELEGEKPLKPSANPSKSCLRANLPTNTTEDESRDPSSDQSVRWKARFDDMEHILEKNLKKLDCDVINDKTVRFSLEQHHLLIGHGAMFSSVYLGMTENKKQVAVKKFNIRKAELLSEQEQIEKLLKLPAHSSLVKYHDIFKDKPNFYLISELGEYSLELVFTPHSTFTLPCSEQSTMMQLTEGLLHLHNNNIIHRNLRPSNVLLSNRGQVKLCDYGLHTSASYHLPNTPTPVRCWVASDIISSKNHKQDLFTESSDISSLGMLFYYISTKGGHPYGDLPHSTDTCLANLQRGTYNLKAVQGNPFTHHIIKNMLFKEPEKRFKLNQVKSHPCFIEESDRVKRLVTMMNIYDKFRSFVTDLLSSHSREILTTYVDRSNLSSLRSSDEVITVTQLFKLIQKCTQEPSYFKQMFGKKLVENETVHQFFYRTFPGLVLSAYDVLIALEKKSPKKKNSRNNLFENGKTVTNSIVKEACMKLNKPPGGGITMLKKNNFAKPTTQCEVR